MKYTVTPSLLAEALSNIIREQSVGMADLEVTAIHGLATTGEPFEISGVELTLQPRKRPVTATADVSGRFTPPVGRGKIKLAAINGEIVQ